MPSGQGLSIDFECDLWDVAEISSQEEPNNFFGLRIIRRYTG